MRPQDPDVPSNEHRGESAERPAPWWRLTRPASQWPPAVGLLLALFTVFLFVGEGDHFHKGEMHNEFTAKNMALAANLSAERGFLFLTMRRAADGTVRYKTYNRFPIGSFVLIKLAMLPFEGDSSAQLAAARTLMLAFFCAAAVLAYLALARLTGSRAVALGATLLAFSSYHVLYYADVVSNETSVDLFAVMLVFHGLVLFKASRSKKEARRRFWQLAARVCVALLLGWHVYGLLLPFLVFAAAAEAITAWRAGATRAFARRLGATAGRVLRGRSVLLGALALVFGTGMLGYNFAREHAALGGEQAVVELPSVRSMLRRTGFAELSGSSAEELAPPTFLGFLKWQFHRAGALCLPVALSGGVELHEGAWRESGEAVFFWPGVIATIGALAGLGLLRRPRAPAAALVLAGFCWACLVPGSTAWSYHQFESMFHVGVPLCLFAALLLAARRVARRAPAVCAAVAMVVFAGSSVALGLRHLDAGEAQTQRALLAEFDAIAKIIRGKTVWVSGDSEALQRFMKRRFLVDFLTAGSFVRYLRALPAANPQGIGALDFGLAFERYPIPALLTPSHRMVFLYQAGADVGAVLAAMGDARRQAHRRLAAGTPAARSVFDIHVVPSEETGQGTGELAYFKAPCDLDDTKGRFFLRLVPVEANVPWGARKRFGERNFPFNLYGVVFEGKCMMRLALPTWPVANVFAGQFHPAGGAADWRVAFRLDVDRLREMLQAARGQTPTARGRFNLYVRRDSRRGLLLYVRAPCVPQDVQRRFFLHVVPVRKAALSDANRARGFDNLDFDFADHGALVDGACVAPVPLPDYDIARVRTGQFDPHAQPDAPAPWQVEFAWWSN